MDRPRHPESGLHYVHVFPPDKVFLESRECYRAAAARLGWMSVEGPEGWTPGRADWADPAVMAVFWARLPELPAGRSAKVAFRYTESVGKPEALIVNQRADMDGFMPRAGEPDLVLVGNPAAAEFMRPFCRRVAHAPIGYEPEVMGTPDWSARKDFDLLFYGTMVGRREWIIPAVEERLGGGFVRIGCFGAERKAEVERAKAVLHVGHSGETSFPGMRLWQAVATSAALITERRDAWPAAEGRHYVGLPVAERERMDVFLDALTEALNASHAEIARRAHEDLSRYTVERCMEEFVVPATVEAALKGTP